MNNSSKTSMLLTGTMWRLHVETACGDCMFAKCNINQTVELKRLIDEQQVAGRRL